MTQKRLLLASFILAIAFPAIAQGPPVRDSWKAAAQKACGSGYTANVDPNSLDQELCSVECVPINKAAQKKTHVLLANGSPCHKHHMVAPPFPLLLGTCSGGFCKVPTP
ncbi:hypothetical protein [Corallococcus exercitus]|uniref:hypothetical protein n=1 Tax=Corallococcus exercitus TaxID=2316736 RepID=UPI001ABFAC17|nr:hypothetical protein [Corallococcus exercitus]